MNTREVLPEQLIGMEQLSDSYAAAVAAATNASTNEFKIRNILVATRPSASSAAALKHAGWLACRFGCKIIVLHAVTRACSAADTQELQSNICKASGIEPQLLRATFIRQGVTDFSPILDIVRDEYADLVVIPADFYKDPLHFWQTNMMEKLIRHLRCPILITPDKSLQPVSN